jgi:hypothetical protein
MAKTWRRLPAKTRLRRVDEQARIAYPKQRATVSVGSVLNDAPGYNTFGRRRVFLCR